MRLVFIAADPMEFRGILRRATPIWQAVSPGNARLGVDWARRVAFAGHDAWLVANGAGRARAAAATRAACEAFQPDAVINTGFCGALDPSLAVADVVAASAIAWDGESLPTRCPETRLAHHSGAVRTADRIVATVAEKAELRRGGCLAVEMEAFAVASEAARRQVPCYCVRAVTDLAQESFANDFNAALRSDGHFDTMLLLALSLRHPTARIPELIRLRNRCARATETLGEFFADCRY